MDEYLTDDEVAAVSRVSIGALAQRRYKGLPPRFLKPTPRTVLYRRSDVTAWLDSSAQTSTAEAPTT